jgi:phosphotransferase system  glucose/maltose/N-acetylglucosamine-specific IIC component
MPGALMMVVTVMMVMMVVMVMVVMLMTRIKILIRSLSSALFSLVEAAPRRARAHLEQ